MTTRNPGDKEWLLAAAASEIVAVDADAPPGHVLVLCDREDYVGQYFLESALRGERIVKFKACVLGRTFFAAIFVLSRERASEILTCYNSPSALQAVKGMVSVSLRAVVVAAGDSVAVARRLRNVSPSVHTTLQ